MKVPSPLALIASLALAASCHAATSDVMGGMVVTIPAGNVLFAPSFVHNDTFVGDITAISEDGVSETTTLTFAGADFSSADYSEGSNFPAYYIEILEAGLNQGLILDVESSETSTLTVHGLLVTDFGLTTDTQIALRKHLTIGEIFEGVSLTQYANTVTFYNGDSSVTIYIWTGTEWVDSGFNPGDNRQVYPGTGVVVQMDSPVDLVISGKVRNSATKIPLYAGAINLVSSGSPVDVTLGGVGFESVLNQYAEPVTAYTDDGVLSTRTVYYYNGTYLADANEGFSDGSSDSIPSTSAVVVQVESDKYLTVPSAY